MEPKSSLPEEDLRIITFLILKKHRDKTTFSSGTIFSVQVEEGWWSGSSNSKSGLFPSNFVKELDATGEEAESNDTTADETGKTAAAAT